MIFDMTQRVGSGGGTSTKIASGTITGAGEYNIVVPVGKKMPVGDFVFSMWVDNGSEFAYGSNYQIASLTVAVKKNLGKYDLSTDGTKNLSKDLSIVSNNSGTTSTKTGSGVSATKWDIRNGSLAGSALGNLGGSNNLYVVRSSSGFSIGLYGNNTTVILTSGMKYNWALYYFGESPSTDIVEVA